MLKIQDYTEQNLKECIDFLNKEQLRVKVMLNSSGFVKYSPMGIIIREYRTKLKNMMFEMMEDLKEDFTNKGIK